MLRGVCSCAIRDCVCTEGIGVRLCSLLATALGQNGNRFYCTEAPSGIALSDALLVFNSGTVLLLGIPMAVQTGCFHARAQRKTVAMSS